MKLTRNWVTMANLIQWLNIGIFTSLPFIGQELAEKRTVYIHFYSLYFHSLLNLFSEFIIVYT